MCIYMIRTIPILFGHFWVSNPILVSNFGQILVSYLFLSVLPIIGSEIYVINMGPNFEKVKTTSIFYTKSNFLGQSVAVWGMSTRIGQLYYIKPALKFIK